MMLAAFWGSKFRSTAVLEVFGVRYSGILSVLEVFRDPVLLILLNTRSISAFSTANTFNTRKYFRIYTARCSNTRSISGFCTARYCWLEYYSEYFTRMLKHFGVYLTPTTGPEP